MALNETALLTAMSVLLAACNIDYYLTILLGTFTQKNDLTLTFGLTTGFGGRLGANPNGGGAGMPLPGGGGGAGMPLPGGGGGAGMPLPGGGGGIPTPGGGGIPTPGGSIPASGGEGGGGGVGSIDVASPAEELAI